MNDEIGDEIRITDHISCGNEIKIIDSLTLKSLNIIANETTRKGVS